MLPIIMRRTRLVLLTSSTGPGGQAL
jgi:hypothetical protein